MKLTTEQTEFVTNAVDRITAYNQLLPATPKLEVQDYRDGFAEDAKNVGEIVALLEYNFDRLAHNRRSLREEKYIDYKENGDGVSRMTGNQIEAKVYLDTKELRTKEIQAKYYYKKLLYFYRSLGDFQNSCASRMKIEE